jgi:metal-responsive CopG/Arc/MetJ family transcriptional regulator
VSDSLTIADVSKKSFRTVPIHARLPEPDVAEVDKAATEELVSRSTMIARIVREWVRRRLPPKRK